MTDKPTPHDQHDSELQLVLTIGIEAFANSSPGG